MSKQINYGWLNDYSGKVFAPITVSSAVLVNLANNTNGSVTTMPLDKFLATQFVTTKNYLNSELNRIEAKFDEVRKHIYYLEDDEWAKGETQGNESNPAENFDKSNGNTYASAKAKTIQSQINDARDRIYSSNDSLIYDSGTHREAKEASNTTITQKSYSSKHSLQGQIFSNDSELYNIQYYLCSTLDPKHLDPNSTKYEDEGKTKLVSANLAEIPYNAQLTDMAVKTANKLSTNISVNKTMKGLVDITNEKLFDKYNNQLIVKADSERTGHIVGTITTTAPDNQDDPTSVGGSTLQLAEHLPDLSSLGEEYKKADYVGVVFSDYKPSIDKVNNKVYFPVKRYTFNRQGLLTEIQAAELTIADSTIYSQKPTLLASTKTGNYPLLCTNTNLNETYYTSTDESTGIYLYYGEEEKTEPVLMGAAWNDYAEYRQQSEVIEPGYCAIPSRDGKLQKTTERLQYCDGIVSDTFGFSIGKSDKAQTPLAVSGRVLAHPAESIESYQIGDPVCASIDGKISKMTRDEVCKYPDRIVGTVSEIPEYEKWNNISINGRIWIKVK